MTMEITYLSNSGFFVRDGGTLLLFDDYADPAHAVERALEQAYDRFYIFASHAHFDHFDTHIRDYADRVTQYIFSYDIRSTKRVKSFPQNAITYMAAYSDWTDGYLHVTAFDSTDVGVSFLVETAEGRRIFHAGDFNWWHWEGDTHENQMLARNAFRKQMKRLEGMEADLAFFPVDARMGNSWDMGIREFVRCTKLSGFVTMHNETGIASGNLWTPPEDFFAQGKAIPFWTPKQAGETRIWDDGFHET